MEWKTGVSRGLKRAFRTVLQYSLRGPNSPPGLRLCVERVTGIEPAWPAWKAWFPSVPIGLVEAFFALQRAFSVPLSTGASPSRRPPRRQPALALRLRPPRGPRRAVHRRDDRSVRAGQPTCCSASSLTSWTCLSTPSRCWLRRASEALHGPGQSAHVAVEAGSTGRGHRQYP